MTAAELLSVAAFVEGRYAQAFPSFGSERMGAPVMAYCRISDTPIRLREPIFQPDALIVQDASLVRHGDLLAGLDQTRMVLINSRLSVDELIADQLKSRVATAGGRIITLPATELALEVIGRNVPNVIMLAAFCAATGLMSLDTIHKAVSEKFNPKVAQLNMTAAERAWQMVVDADQAALELTHA